MINTLLKWALILILALIAPLIYTTIQSYITINMVFPLIKLLSVTSKILLASIFIVCNTIGAAITALITALPCAYLLKKHANVIAGLLILTTLCIPVYTAIMQTDVRAFSVVVFLGQCIAVVILIIIFAKIGCRIAQWRLRGRS